MTPQGEKPGSLFDTLVSRGWACEGDRLYPPNSLFWTRGMRGRKTPQGMLLNMYRIEKAALESNRVSKPAHWSAEQHHAWVRDMESLVDALE